jgi:hypothetical protein
MHTKILGIVIIILGGALFLENLGIIYFDLANFWPVFILIAAYGFFQSWYQNREQVGQLFVAVILGIYGIFFQYNELTYWVTIEYLWPVFILAPGVGFVAMYWFSSNRDRGHLIPGLILLAIGSIFLIVYSPLNDFWPVILIALGIGILIKGRSFADSGEATEN